MNVTLCLRPGGNPVFGQVTKVIVIVVIVTIVTRHAPAAAGPLIAGLVLGCWFPASRTYATQRA